MNAIRADKDNAMNIPIKRVEIPPKNLIVVEKFKLFIYVCYWYDDLHKYDAMSYLNPYCKDIKRLETETLSHFKEMYSKN